MKNQRGYVTFRISILAWLLIAAMMITGMLMNNRGATEARALEGAKSFINENQLAIERLTCTGDSDGDGYGSCTVVTSEGEKIHLSCVTGYLDTHLWDAKGCKEVDMRWQGMGVRGH